MKKARYFMAALVLLSLIIALYPAGKAAAADDTPHIKRVVGVLNINTGTVDQFNRLRGVDLALAQKIVDYREANGPFKNIQELTKVEGFTDKLFHLNQLHLTVSGETTLRWVRVQTKDK